MIAIFPIVRNAGVAEYKAHEIGIARLSPNIVGEEQHATATALQADEAVGGLRVVAAFVESAALGSLEHDHSQTRREVWPLFSRRQIRREVGKLVGSTDVQGRLDHLGARGRGKAVAPHQRR